jgi:phosphonate metabolism-associated iron-containing alcohol dehydrogenase
VIWSFHNPVRITFGEGALDRLPALLGGRRYLLVTYGEPHFAALAERIAATAGTPLAVIDGITPNPDFDSLSRLTAQHAEAAGQAEAIVALGGGSVIDAAKVFSASPKSFALVERYLLTGKGADAFAFVPVLAVPTTAGTGSEVTSWATVWDTGGGKKYSLAHARLMPEHALVDPELMVAMPRGLTVSTGLDALSHALESIWNKNANPISADLAVSAASDVLTVLPPLAEDLASAELRRRMAKAALMAGLAFSNTKTALAHALSYPITLQQGVPHGLACSFTLPLVMASVIGADAAADAALKRIFGDDLTAGVARLAAFLEGLGVSTSPGDYGVSGADFRDLITGALEGERGRNFIGSKEQVLAAAAAKT